MSNLTVLKAAAFGRLCVETAQMEGMKGFNDGSDLRVAVC